MKVCIIGDGLVSLSLANVLMKKDLEIDILVNTKKKIYNKTRTIGISKSNIDFFNNEIVNIKKILWEIKKIKVLTENSSNKEILNFTNDNKQIFSIIKNYKLNELLLRNLKKGKNVNFKKKINLENILKDNYNLIVNCDPKHEITNKYFYKKIKKNYNSYAYTTIINHKKKEKNNIAYQNFTNEGPIAFLPISNSSTSVIYSLRSRNINTQKQIKKLIKKFNPNYLIKKIDDCASFKLQSSNLRKYYKNNILAFGDLLHKIHPLAGQGFNMSLRDIKLLSELIDNKLNLGMQIDGSVCYEFQKNSRDRNYIFATGIDWIYEIFNFESKTKSKFISKTINFIGQKKLINSFFKKYADNGIRI